MACVAVTVAQTDDCKDTSLLSVPLCLLSKVSSNTDIESDSSSQ